MKEIYFAGGCFWGVEEFFSRIKGVTVTEVGYLNGNTEAPSYKEVCCGDTGYAEAVRVGYEPDTVSLDWLVRKFFTIIDPLSKDRQGNDVGEQYRTGVYYTNEKDRGIIERIFEEEQKKHSKPMVTELGPVENFYKAEEYHQNYLKKNPGGYCHIDLGEL